MADKHQGWFILGRRNLRKDRQAAHLVRSKAKCCLQGCIAAAFLCSGMFDMAFLQPGASMKPTAPLQRRLLLCGTFGFLACQPAAHAEFIKTESGLQYEVIKEGTGPMPKKGEQVVVSFESFTKGFGGPEGDKKAKQFESSTRIVAGSEPYDEPMQFQVGAGRVVQGWDEALLTMRVGERRRIIIPPSLGYGARAIPQVPGNSTLYSIIELLEVRLIFLFASTWVLHSQNFGSVCLANKKCAS